MTHVIPINLKPIENDQWSGPKSPYETYERFEAQSESMLAYIQMSGISGTVAVGHGVYYILSVYKPITKYAKTRIR